MFVRVCADSCNPSLIDPFFETLGQVEFQVALDFTDHYCRSMDGLIRMLHCRFKQADARPYWLLICPWFYCAKINRDHAY
jgi:hypothetical protein